MLKKIKENKMLCFFALLLLVEFVWIVYKNFTCGADSVDYDSAKLMVHATEMARTGKLMIPNWRYQTTHEIDSAMLLAVPFYAMTKNVYAAFAMSNTIFVLVFGYVIVQLLRNLGLEIKYIAATCALIFMPWEFGMLEYVNMLFLNGGQYSIKVIIPLLGLAIITLPKQGVKHVVLTAIYLFLTFLCAFSSGIFPIIVGILPLSIIYFFHWIFREDKTEISVKNTVTIVLGLAGSFAGLLVHEALNISERGMDAQLISSDTFTNQLLLCFTEYFRVFNALPHFETPIVSLKGIGYLIRFVLAAFFFIVGAKYMVDFFRRLIRKESTKKEGFVDYLALVIVFNVAIHLLSTYYAHRYYLVEMICLLILVGIELPGIVTKASVKMRTALGLLWAVLMLGCFVTSTRYINNVIENFEYRFCYEICDEIERQNVDNVIVVNDTQLEEICRLMLLDQRFSNYMTIQDTFVSYDWYKNTNEADYYGESSVMIIRNGNEISDVFGADIAAMYEYITTVADFDLYRADSGTKAIVAGR